MKREDFSQLRIEFTDVFFRPKTDIEEFALEMQRIDLVPNVNPQHEGRGRMTQQKLKKAQYKLR